MDLYVPIREHRLTWRGTAGVVVGATLNVDESTVRVFRADGVASPYGRAGAAEAPPLLLLHPAERKSRRVYPQAQEPGLVIQEPDDGELSGSIVITGPDGDRTVVELYDLVRAGPSSLPGNLAAGIDYDTYLATYMIYQGDGIGSAEIEWTATFYSSCGISLGVSNTIRIEDREPNRLYDTPEYLSGGAPTESGECLEVELVETDQFQDDYWGNTILVDSEENTLQKTTFDGTDYSEFTVDWRADSSGPGGPGDPGGGTCPCPGEP